MIIIIIRAEMMMTNCMCQDKKEEGGLPAFKRASMHRYNDEETI